MYRRNQRSNKGFPDTDYYYDGWYNYNSPVYDDTYDLCLIDRSGEMLELFVFDKTSKAVKISFYPGKIKAKGYWHIEVNIKDITEIIFLGKARTRDQAMPTPKAWIPILQEFIDKSPKNIKSLFISVDAECVY